MGTEARLRVELPKGSATHGGATAPRRSAESPVEQAVSRGVKWMLSAQSQEGYWWGELEADTTLESDYILYLHILAVSDSPKIPKLAKYIRDRQLSDGGWNIFYGGPAELNATVKAWVGLRLAGDAATSPHSPASRAPRFTSSVVLRRRIPTPASISRWSAPLIGVSSRPFRLS